jgi:hypothetical protein
VRRQIPYLKPGKRGACALALSVGLLLSRHSRASGCVGGGALTGCFDANSLWLPAGRASFMVLPDTRATAVRQMSFGVAGEWLHGPVTLHVASPDQGGRSIHVLDTALDMSFFLAFGVFKSVELSLAAPTRVYQTGAGSGAVASQSAFPLERTAVRSPRVGLAYSLDDALAVPGVGVRLALDAALPLADQSELSGERSVVTMPSVALSTRTGAFRLEASLGVRLRQALDYGSVRLGNQGYGALGLGLEALRPGLLFVAVEAFMLPSLGESRAAAANATISSESLVPAEWLLSLHSCFAVGSPWTLGLAAGGGLPLSSETRETAAGPTTSHFLGMGTPDFRSLLVLRFTPAEPTPAAGR